MSGGHHAPSDLTPSELDDLLDEALANPKIKSRLARSYSLICDYDIALLGSSSVGGAHVYLDRHLRESRGPYGLIYVKRKKLNVVPGLIRHERLEQALEDELGWPYKLAHPVAQHWEERDYIAKGFYPADVEASFQPFIKHDERERITRSPTDLDMRPLLSPPKSTTLIAHINDTAQKEKRPHPVVGYVRESRRENQACGKCSMFIKPVYGGPACTLVQSPIVEGGWCRRFKAGALENPVDSVPRQKVAQHA